MVAIEGGLFSLLVVCSVYDGAGGVLETDANVVSAGLRKMSPVSCCLVDDDIPKAICKYIFTYYSNFIFINHKWMGRFRPHFSQEVIRYGTV